MLHFPPFSSCSWFLVSCHCGQKMCLIKFLNLLELIEAYLWPNIWSILKMSIKSICSNVALKAIIFFFPPLKKKTLYFFPLPFTPLRLRLPRNHHAAISVWVLFPFLLDPSPLWTHPLPELSACSLWVCLYFEAIIFLLIFCLGDYLFS